MSYPAFKAPKPGTFEHDFMLILSSICPGVSKCRCNFRMSGLVEYSYPYAVSGEALIKLAKVINYLDLGNNFSIGHAGGQTIFSLKSYRASHDAIMAKRVAALIAEAKEQ